MTTILLIVIWLLSPIVLGILLAINISRKNKLTKTVDFFTSYFKHLYTEQRISEEDYRRLLRKAGKHHASSTAASDMRPETVFSKNTTRSENATHLENVTRVAPATVTTANRSDLTSGSGANLTSNPASDFGMSKKAIRKPINTLNIVLIIGVLFIVLAGLIFATTSWAYLHNFVKVIIVSSLVIVFFATSILADTKLQLKQTGIAFYTLGSIFLPIAVVAIGYFNLLGNWFSLYGAGRYVLGLTAFALLGIATAIGASKYRSKYFIWAAYACLTFSVLCLARSIFTDTGILALCFAVYCLAVTLLSPRITSYVSAHADKSYTTLLNHWQMFSIINVATLAILSLAISGNGIPSSIAALIFACLFLGSDFQTVDKFYNGFPFAILLMIGFIKLNINNAFDTGLLLMALSGSAILLSDMMNLLSRQIKNGISIALLVAVVLPYIFGSAAYWTEETTWTLPLFLSTIILLINITWMAVKYQYRPLIYLHPLFTAILLGGVIDLFLPAAVPVGLAVSALSLAAFGVYVYLERFSQFACLRSRFADILFALGCLWAGFYDLSYFYFGASLTLAQLWTNLFALSAFCFLLGVLSLSRKIDIVSQAASFILPYALLLPLIPIATMINRNSISLLENNVFLVFSGLLTLVAVILLLQDKQKIADRYELSLAIAISLYGVFAPLVAWYDFNDRLYPVFFWLLTGYWGVQCLIQQKRITTIGKSLGATRLLYIVGAGLLVSLFCTAHGLFPDALLGWLLLVPASASALLFLAYLRVRDNLTVLPSGLRNAEDLNHFCAWAIHLLMYFTASEYFSDHRLPPVYAIAVLALITLAFYTLYSRRHTLLGVFSLPLVYPLAFETVAKFSPASLAEDTVYLFTALAIFAVFAGFSRILYTQLYTVEGKNIATAHFDWFAVSSILSPVYLLSSNDQHWQFVGCILLAAYALLFYKRLPVPYGDRIVLSATAIAVCLAYWTQPFFTFPDILETELNLLPLIVLAFVMQRNIWKGSFASINQLPFTVVSLSLLVLAMDAITYEYTTDALIIGISSLFILIIAFYFKSKRWFLLSSVTLVLLALYMSRSFWLSLAWWIYLLAAGILLLSIAAYNERSKQKRQQLTKRLSRFMDDWSW